MTTQEQNELLTRTGPGTSMGELFRRYWLPALLCEELPEPDCPQVRVKLLSERLIAFRDTEGRLGLIDEFCAHRGVSLWFGRNEEGGLRCPYHGWKYDVTGQCTEVPSMPVESGFCEKIKLRSYPLVEHGGALWTYMGPPELQPPLPEFEFAMVAPKQRFVSKRFQDNNYMQAMEGGIDSSHSAFLHRGELQKDPLFKGAGKKQAIQPRGFPGALRSSGIRWRFVDRLASESRERQFLLAYYPVGAAMLHRCAAARCQFVNPRPFLDPDRRRNLLGLELQLSSAARIKR